MSLSPGEAVIFRKEEEGEEEEAEKKERKNDKGTGDKEEESLHLFAKSS